MTPSEVLHYAREAARAGRLQFTRHAQQRMAERGAFRADVEHACKTATDARHERDDVWKLSGGVDRVGDALVVVAEVDPSDVLVITVIG